jgi:L-ascorbate metabolism protein UlaG (beta-lactamase superfamily)
MIEVSERQHGFAGGGESMPGEVELWWLGQAGFALRNRDYVVLVDPYLSDSLARKYRGTLFPHERMTPVPLLPETITRCDWYLCTHAHTDHMDPLTIRGVVDAAGPRFVVPAAEAERATSRGVPAGSLIPIDAGERVVLAPDIAVEAIPSAHESLETDELGRHRCLGYIVSLGPVRVYHSGDCVPFEGQAEMLSGKGIDVALLPVNGRDAYRREHGVPGNFTAGEAVALCEAAGIPDLVCHHFGMFAFNTVAPAAVADELERAESPVRWLLPTVGTTYSLYSPRHGDSRAAGASEA